jgi:hypothetical protein
MAEADNSFFLRLGIAILVVFGLLIAGFALYPILKFKWYEERLLSDDPDMRWAAFMFLSSHGERGQKVIENFCRRRTDTGWGPVQGGLRLRIRTKGYLFDYFGEKHCIVKYGAPRNFTEHDFSEKVLVIHFEIQNIDCDSITIKMYEGEVHNGYFSRRYERYTSGVTSHGHGSPMSPDDYKTIGKSETISGKKQEWGWMRAPGIYFWEYDYYGSNPWQRSNCICFAILPEK